MLTLEKFEEASEIVKNVTLETKLMYSEYLSRQTGAKVYLKPENMQFTGAYKVRGAYYKISTLSEEERKKGLITASAGNHAQGVAYAASRFGAKAVIVMPTSTPLKMCIRDSTLPADAAILRNFAEGQVTKHDILIYLLRMLRKQFAVKIIQKCLLYNLLHFNHLR